MNYKIKKGDRFLCLEDYVMDDERIAYSKGKIYKSDLDGRITDNEFDVLHEMEGQNYFFEYFELVVSDLKLLNKSKLEEALKQSISLLMQTTEFEVLESFKLKVAELKKVLEENNSQPLTITCRVLPFVADLIVQTLKKIKDEQRTKTSKQHRSPQ